VSRPDRQRAEPRWLVTLGPSPLNSGTGKRAKTFSGKQAKKNRDVYVSIFQKRRIRSASS
jgi:hypothetical protein